jgi:Integrase core domain
VCGPFEVESLGGNRYFLTFIDDASRKVWVYFLRTKDQVFNYFQEFHVMVERETDKKLKCLRSDNGGEYTSKEFKAYCAKYRIRHEKTVPGTPQHNGVAERMNRTIVEKVRCMLKMAKLPKQFWGEAVRTSCYLINRSPSVPLKFEISERVWSKKNVSYSHLRVFECKAYVHIPKERRSKLDDKATPCIFLGYGNEEFGYRLWDLEKRRIVRCKDVVFYEDQIKVDLNNDKKSERVGESIELTPVPSLVQSAATDKDESNEEATEETSNMMDSDDDDDIIYDAPEQGEQH